MHKRLLLLVTLLAASALLVACGGEDEDVENDQTAEEEARSDIPTVGVVIDTGSQNDRSFNQYSLEGVQRALAEYGAEPEFISPDSTQDYEAAIERLITDGAEFIVTVGFRMGDPTARAAERHPDVRFAIVDNAYFPGAGCSQEVENCYTDEGGLPNVTSLMFSEDQVAYLAGTLAACMTESGTIASVAGIEIPPVVRFVTGYQAGATAFDPEVETLNQYVPDFNDPDQGEVVAAGFINDGADVIFAPAGETGNGGLKAAHEAELMAIGVDVDQYFTYEEVAPSLITSASKNVDLATQTATEDFLNGELEAGIRLFTLENGGIGLAPYHDWEDRIPQVCKDAVEEARTAVIEDPSITGVE